MSKEQITEKLQRVAKALGNGWRVDLLKAEHQLPDLFNPNLGYRITIYQGWGVEHGKIRLSGGKVKINLSWSRPAKHLAADIERRLFAALAKSKAEQDQYQAQQRAREETANLIQQAAQRIYPRLERYPGNYASQRKLCSSKVELNIFDNEITLKVSHNADFILTLLGLIAQQDQKHCKTYRVTLTSEQLTEPYIWQGLAHSSDDAKDQARAKAHTKNRAYYRAKANIEEITA